jgi:hypothetical protein
VVALKKMNAGVVAMMAMRSFAKRRSARKNNETLANVHATPVRRVENNVISPPNNWGHASTAALRGPELVVSAIS